MMTTCIKFDQGALDCDHGASFAEMRCLVFGANGDDLIADRDGCGGYAEVLDGVTGMATVTDTGISTVMVPAHEGSISAYSDTCLRSLLAGVLAKVNGGVAATAGGACGTGGRVLRDADYMRAKEIVFSDRGLFGSQ